MCSRAKTSRTRAAARSETLDVRLLYALLGVLGLGAACLAAAPVLAAPGDEASAAMADTEGNEVGTVELTQMQHGVLLTAKLTGLPEGTLAFHVHETGLCEPPFTSAGGHYNPDSAKHGFGAEDGPHSGDMPNIYVPASGDVTFEVLNANLELDDSLLDADGAAIVIHAGPDDYQSDPAGNAGDRIACGVIKSGTGG